MRRPLVVLAILLPLAVPVAVPAAAAGDQPPAQCADGKARLEEPERGADGSRPQLRPHADGRYTPILLVHGWTGDPSMWSKPISLSTLKTEPRVNHSLVGNLQGLRGAAVYTLDYYVVAQKWFLEPGAGGKAFLEAERCLSDQPAFAGHRMIIVAHSMGGLIVRWSLSDAAPDGPGRRGRVGLVLTLGTPYDGSDIAAVGTALFDGAVASGVVVDKRFAALVTVIHLLISFCHDVDFVGCHQLNYLVDWLAAAHKFATGSPDMRALATWPAGTRVETLGTRTVVEDVSGLFNLPGDDADLGDVIVPVRSATSGEYPEVVPACRLTAQATQAGWDDLMTKLGQKATIDAKTYWLLGLLGICYHANEAQLIQLSNEVLGAIADQLAAAEPEFAYLTATELAVVRGERVAFRTTGAFGPYAAGPGFTADGRFLYAVDHRGASNAAVVTLDTRTGARRGLSCGGCASAASLGQSTIGWIDSRDYVRSVDLSTNAAPQATSYQMPAPGPDLGALGPPVLAGVVGRQLVVAEDRAAGASIKLGSLTILEPDGTARRIDTENVGRIAISDSGRVATVIIGRPANCPSTAYVKLLNPSSSLNGPALPLDEGDLGSNTVSDLWWGRDGALYATASSHRCDASPGTPLVAPGIWRFDGRVWTLVDQGPVASVRQLTAATKAVVLPNGVLYTETNGRGTEVARNVLGIEMPPHSPDPGGTIERENLVASFAGEWHVHGLTLVVNATGDAQVTINAGPCTPQSDSLCTLHGTATVSPNDAGATLAYTTVTVTDQSGRTVAIDNTGLPRVGDAYRMHLADANLMRLAPLTPNAAEILGNPYLCRNGVSAEAAVLCS